MAKLVGIGKFRDNDTKFQIDADIKSHGSRWKGYMVEQGKVKKFLWNLPLEVSSSGKMKGEGLENGLSKFKIEGKVTFQKKR